MIEDHLQQPVGDKVVGLGLLELGAGWLHYERPMPPGLKRHELTALECFGEPA